MDEVLTEEEYTRRPGKIKYSTEIFKREEKPKMFLRDYTDMEGRNKWAIVLTYESLDNIPQEVILGTLDTTIGRKEKALTIVQIITRQLEENMDPESEYTAYTRLQQYINSNTIPFDFTVEGMDVISYKSEQETEIQKTAYINGQGKLEYTLSKQELDEIKQEKKENIRIYILNKKSDKKWAEIREWILNNNNEEQIAKFLKGEEIANIMQQTEITDEDTKRSIDKKTSAKSRVIADYLLDVSESSEEETGEKKNPRQALLNVYIAFKEKALASDAKATLDALQKKVYEKIENQRGEVAAKDSEEIEILENYKQFFDLIENGRDLNARIYALKIRKIDFGLLKQIIARFNEEDKELLEYIEYKEEMIEETQTDNTTQREDEYPSVSKLNEFLLRSSIRDKNREEVEQIVLGIFEQYKVELLQNNTEEIEYYNSYAKRLKRYVCPTMKVEKRSMLRGDTRDDEPPAVL